MKNNIQDLVTNAIRAMNKKVEVELLNAIIDNPTTCPIEIPLLDMFGKMEVRLFYLRDLNREPLWYYLTKLI